MYDILNSSFLHFSISTYFTIILTFCFPIRISETDWYTIANRFAAILLTSYKDTACHKLDFCDPDIPLTHALVLYTTDSRRDPEMQIGILQQIVTHMEQYTTDFGLTGGFR